MRLKGQEKNWLLIKHEDKYAKSVAHPWKDTSILSGQSLADLQSVNKSGKKKKTK